LFCCMLYQFQVATCYSEVQFCSPDKPMLEMTEDDLLEASSTTSPASSLKDASAQVSPELLLRTSSSDSIKPPDSERIVINVGGRRFETYGQTLAKFPESLLGVMFAERNKNIRKPDRNGEYFFDRSPVPFESILNFYRTGNMRIPPGMSRKQLELELDYFQIPASTMKKKEKLGDRLAASALQAARSNVGPKLSIIKDYIISSAHFAAEKGEQSVTIEFKSSSPDFYSFLSNFSHRELLLQDLLAQNFDVSFNDITSAQGHSYILNITLWTRFSTQKVEDTLSALAMILEELREGVEVKTTKNDHILSIKKY